MLMRRPGGNRSHDGLEPPTFDAAMDYEQVSVAGFEARTLSVCTQRGALPQFSRAADRLHPSIMPRTKVQVTVRRVHMAARRQTRRTSDRSLQHRQEIQVKFWCEKAAFFDL